MTFVEIPELLKFKKLRQRRPFIGFMWFFRHNVLRVHGYVARLTLYYIVPTVITNTTMLINLAMAALWLL